MRDARMKQIVVLGVVCAIYLAGGFAAAQNPMPTEPLFEGEKKYG